MDIDEFKETPLEATYGQAIFYETLMLVCILYLGMKTFGFERHADQKQNLLENFLYFLLLVLMMSLVPWLYRQIFARKKTPIEEELESIEAGEYKNDLIKLYRDSDYLLPPRKQQIALVTAFVIMLFELFYLNAWMKEGILVWQPEWVNSIIAWVKSHTNTPPLNIDRDIFDLDISDTPFKQFFANEQEFMNSPLMDTFFLFQFWRFISYGVFLLCWCILLWRILDNGGMERLDPRNIQSDGQFLLVSFISLFFCFGLVLVPLPIMLYIANEMTGLMILDNAHWLEGLKMLLMLTLLNIISLKLWQGWFIYWKRQFFD